MAGEEGESSEHHRVVSNGRPGLKREFMFAQQSQYESSGSLSRLRVRKRVGESDSGNNEEAKRRTVIVLGDSDVEEQAKSDVVDLTVEDGGGVVESMTRRDDRVTDGDGDGEGEVKGVPSKLKELLETGLLEGLNVRYIRGSKSGQSNKGLAGVIKGIGILCSCDECKGVQIISPTQFELHAGSANKRPADYIYLENQNTLRDLLNACKHAKLEHVTATIRAAISSSPEQTSAFCHRCREPISDARTDRMMMLCLSCSEADVSQKTPRQTTDTKEHTDRSVKHVTLQRACNERTDTDKVNRTATSRSCQRVLNLRLHYLRYYYYCCGLIFDSDGNIHMVKVQQ